MLKDFRFGLRMLLKHPGFTAVAILTLALGLGTNTAIFSVVSAFFLEPLPVKDADRLVMVLQRSALWKLPHGHSYLDYVDYRDHISEFSDTLAVLITPVHLSVRGQTPERTWIEAVSGNYFEMFGVRAAVGRTFLPEEGQQPDKDPVVVLAHHYWQRRFGGDPSVVGSTIILNGHPFQVIGVAPANFTSAQWSLLPSAFVPATMLGQVMQGGGDLLKDRGAPMFKVMARLKPGVSLAQAQSAVTTLAAQLREHYPKEHEGASVSVVPEQHCRPEPTFSDFMPLVAVVFTMLVGLVLLIACANVANLMLARAVARQKEMGIRAAVGASRARLIRQLLAESLLLAVVAGAVGLIFAYWTGRLMSTFQPSMDIPVRTDQPWDWRVFLFTFLLAIVAGVITGLGPALRATKLNLQGVLKEGGGALPGSERHLFRSLLVVSQVAISLVVMVCAGLFVQSLRQVAKLDLGFAGDRVLMASLDLALQGYNDERGRQFYKQLVDKVGALPGVESVSLASAVPFDYGFRLAEVGPEGKAGARKEDYSITAYSCVEHRYFKTMGITLLRGRDFTERDDASAPQVAVANATLAERFWPGQNPLGKRVRFGVEGPLIEIVGVAKNGRYVMLGEEPRPYLYLPLAQHYAAPVTIHVKASGDPRPLAPALRQVIGQLDPDLPIFNVRTMQEHMGNSMFALMPLRMGAGVAALQGLLGLLLAVMGIYAVVAYAFTQRTREIGIRLALGARRLDVLKAVVRDGLRLTAIGMGIGLVIAFGLTRFMSRLLYGLSPTSALAFVGVVILLGGVALLACYLPARRATKVDPVVALRYE